ncbi:aminotransferase class I/II-fold pyridoxal phosphate-dependent enzyme [Bradyrhizobium sp. 142]|uniref:aminotransferase class I/II-fold pyridoxal phosphate-dependent enzyme n=1 Tax=Bradyrhizobium sp. 142 TaxID=2782618 RepID=UPI001FFAE9B8|nr:aminotransferase class I/II-fold pyridoxal phosphate-dependent enzyme [Bradyrhizobium sp. 142]
MKLDAYVTALHALKEDDRLRGLKPRTGVDFASNDYLALASAYESGRGRGWHADRSRRVGLLRGNREEHESLQAEAVSFFGARTAIFFGVGYIPNFAHLTTLPQRGDLLVLDSLVHASVHEGACAGRAEFQISVHNDSCSVENIIRDWRPKGGIGRAWIVVESLYSMDGDFAPLEDLVAIADRYDAFLIVDEAHATGVYGEQGRELTGPYEGRENLLVVHTCGKALSAAGALHCMRCAARFHGQSLSSIHLRRRTLVLDGHRRAGSAVDPAGGVRASAASGQARRVYASADA